MFFLLKNRRAKFVCVLLVLALLFPCCVQRPEPPADRIGVIVSIPPQEEMVRRVGGDKVYVTVMVPRGGDPHTYEPSASQLVEASRARAYVKVGSGIEFELSWMDKILAVNRELEVIDSSDGIDRMASTDADEPGMDVHIWTSVRNARKMAQNVYLGLARIDPGNAEVYRENYEAYARELASLDREIMERTSALKQKKFIVYHPAWGYFARDYGMVQIPIEQEGKEPTARWMESVIKEARRENIKVIFASPAYSTASAETLSKEIGGRVVLIDHLSPDYTTSMRKVSEAFASA